VLRTYRIFEKKHAATAFTGEGARLYGGRWNSPGIAMIYTASSLSLAILEMLVNAAGVRLPPGVVYATVDVPDDLAPQRLERKRLPSAWDATPAPLELAAIGDAWIVAGSSVALLVPSAVAKIENNVLLNPAHRDFRRLRFGKPQLLDVDRRLRRSSS
jgi:RES domain-containing protein